MPKRLSPDQRRAVEFIVPKLPLTFTDARTALEHAMACVSRRNGAGDGVMIDSKRKRISARERGLRRLGVTVAADLSDDPAIAQDQCDEALRELLFIIGDREFSQREPEARQAS